MNVPQEPVTIIWNRSVPIATVVGTPSPKINAGMSKNPPPAPNKPAKNPTAKPTTTGMNTDRLSIPDTGRET